MTTLGRIEEFDTDKDDWQEYVELEFYFVANGVKDAVKKRSAFLLQSVRPHSRP